MANRWFVAGLLVLAAAGTARAQDSADWAVRLGGGGANQGNAVTADVFGDLLVAGSFTNLFQVGNQTLSGTNPFIAKLDRNNGQVKWVHGYAADNGQIAAVATDSQGNIYVTGSFGSEAVPTLQLGEGAPVLKSNGNVDVFVAKFTSDGKHVWSKSFGGTAADEGLAIAVDKNGNAIVGGYFQGSLHLRDNPPVDLHGQYAGFLVKYDTNGELLWATRVADTGYDFVHGLCLDAQGNVGVTGALQVTGYNAYVAKFDTDGKLKWMIKSTEALMSAQGGAIAADKDGNFVVVGGYIQQIHFPGMQNPLLGQGTEYTSFVAKFSAATGVPLWSKGFGNEYNHFGTGIAVDSSGNAVVTGAFRGNVDFGGGMRSSGGLYNAYVVVLSGATGGHVSSRVLNKVTTTQGVYANGLCTYDGNVFVTGWFLGQADFGGGPLKTVDVGGSNVFVARYKE